MAENRSKAQDRLLEACCLKAVNAGLCISILRKRRRCRMSKSNEPTGDPAQDSARCAFKGLAYPCTGNHPVGTRSGWNEPASDGREHRCRSSTDLRLGERQQSAEGLGCQETVVDGSQAHTVVPNACHSPLAMCLVRGEAKHTPFHAGRVWRQRPE